jgi:type I restriction enzyme M protein
VDDKWLATLDTAIHGEMDRISQALTQRVKELAERYETPMPQHAYLDCTLQALHIQRSVEQHDPENLHQIVGAIHAQPRCIDG